ncbi:MBOAT family protein [Novipirellula sp.]|uniref:MBOAT family O-acyltransferase n=1 Tax=Novipirellula sp. TaxID=2795430 RepID=UPI0035680588
MLFNSWFFLLFLATLLPLYFLLKHRAQNVLLLVASYTFYSFWDYRFLSLIFASTLCDYIIARTLQTTEGETQRKVLLSASCILNLSLLGIFKYFNFFASSFAGVLTALGLQANYETLQIVLPVGISFYTFQTMSYTIDVYRRSLDAETNFLNFALFVSFFPQLVAGPIERASNLLPQIRLPRTVSVANWIDGGWLILKGFFLKMVIADNLAIVSNEVFSVTRPESCLLACIGILAFTFQIYGDFAGYSKIARGVSLLLGIRLMRNFALPYSSLNPSEFWSRWHISLSSWLRDYLYIPLGGSRHGRRTTYRNLMTTMVLGGLWHGAAWTFVAWGVFHGLLLIAYRAKDALVERSRASAIGVFFQWLVFFAFTCFGWLLFRAESFPQVLGFLQALASFDLTPTNQAVFLAVQLAIFAGMMISFDVLTKDSDHPSEIRGWNFGIGPSLCTAILIAIIVLTPLQSEAFVYFQF